MSTVEPGPHRWQTGTKHVVHTVQDYSSERGSIFACHRRKHFWILYQTVDNTACKMIKACQCCSATMLQDWKKKKPPLQSIYVIIAILTEWWLPLYYNTLHYILASLWCSFFPTDHGKCKRKRIHGIPRDHNERFGSPDKRTAFVQPRCEFLPVQRGPFFIIRRSIDQLENIESDVRPWRKWTHNL